MATMTSGDTLSELERRAESNRAELAHTFDALHSRVSPEALKHEAREYAKQTGRTLLGSIEAGARDNPLAALAVAGGLAVPLWRLAASIPAPLLLIGAGLAMSRSGHGRGASSAPVHQREGAASGNESGDVLGGVEARIREVGTQATEAIHQSAERVRNMASDTVGSVKETTHRVSSGAAEIWQNSQGGFADMMQRNPLLVGGLVFAAGGLLAAALPGSRPENRIMGEARDQMMDRAREVADTGFGAAKAAADAVVESTSDRVRSEGLTPDFARQAVAESVSRMGNVVEEIADAGDLPSNRRANNRKSTRSERNNG